MKNIYTFPIILFLVLLMTPFQFTLANAVPVEKATNTKTKVKKHFYRKRLKHHHKKQRKTRPNQFLSPTSTNNGYDVITTIIIVSISLYFAIAITLIILGFYLVLPALWIIGFSLIGIPLLFTLIAIIIGSINAAKKKKAGSNNS